MTKEHIEEVSEKLCRMTERCITFPGYKVLAYFKNADNLKIFLDNVYKKIEHNCAEYDTDISGTEISSGYITDFGNGSSVNLFVENNNVIGEKCNVLFVDSKIRDNELMELAPSIGVYNFEGGGLLNPKPIYFSVD